MADYASLTPVDIVTGFLGAGKTTLLARLLRAPELRDTVVLVNEFGEVGLDHHLLEAVAESTLLLENGCLCCAIRDDLVGALRDLLSRRQRGELPAFSRVVVETSGLADPAPIAFTVLSEPVLRHHFRLARVVTLVDAVNGLAQLAAYPESVKQVAIADCVVVTKTDLVGEGGSEALHRRIEEINAGVAVHRFDFPGPVPAALLVGAEDRVGEADEWRARLDALEGLGEAAHGPGGAITSFALRFEGPLEWTAFGIWLTMLLNRHGERVLRVKGLVNVAGVDTPVLLNGVQHVVHPPMHLEAWPSDDRSSRIVFIVDGLAREDIERSLAAFNALAAPAPVEAIGAYSSASGSPSAAPPTR